MRPSDPPLCGTSSFGLGTLMRLQRRHTPVAPSALAGDLVRRGGAPPGGEDAGYVVRLEHRRGCWIGGDLLPRSGIARAVIRNAAGRVEFDRLERAHEGPAQTKSVFQRDVEVLRADHALPDQTERFGLQHPLQAVENEAEDFAVD